MTVFSGISRSNLNHAKTVLSQDKKKSVQQRHTEINHIFSISFYFSTLNTQTSNLHMISPVLIWKTLCITQTHRVMLLCIKAELKRFFIHIWATFGTLPLPDCSRWNHHIFWTTPKLFFLKPAYIFWTTPRLFSLEPSHILNHSQTVPAGTSIHILNHSQTVLSRTITYSEPLPDCSRWNQHIFWTTPRLFSLEPSHILNHSKTVLSGTSIHILNHSQIVLSGTITYSEPLQNCSFWNQHTYSEPLPDCSLWNHHVYPEPFSLETPAVMSVVGARGDNHHQTVGNAEDLWHTI